MTEEIELVKEIIHTTAEKLRAIVMEKVAALSDKFPKAGVTICQIPVDGYLLILDPKGLFTRSITKEPGISNRMLPKIAKKEANDFIWIQYAETAILALEKLGSK